MRLLILGAGLMARGALDDHLSDDDVTSVVVADRSQPALDTIAALFDDPRVSYVLLDLEDRAAVEALMREADGALSSAHYRYNPALTEIAVATGTNMVDLGGNNDMVRAQLAMDDRAAAAGVSIIPDCGLAPGLASVLVAWGMARFDWVDTVRIRVGGLPLVPREPLRYERLFSVEGLINEYVEPPLSLRDGEIVTGQPLGDLEDVDFDAPLGTLEAFNTSGGVSTLPESFGDRLRNIDYKTLRYPGHAHAMRWLLELGLFGSDPVDVDGSTVIPRRLVGQAIERHVPLSERDRTVVRVEFEGAGKAHRLQIIDEHDETTGLSSMMRTTAFPAATINRMQCRGEVTRTGVVPQELALDPDIVLGRLVARGLPIDGLVAAPVA